MSAVKPYQNLIQNEPSTFALLVDNIRNMDEAEQKLLWLQLNQKKLSEMAKKLDESVVPNNLSEDEIYSLVK